MISGGETRKLMLPGSLALGEDNVATRRTSDRLAEAAAMRKPEVTKTQAQILGEQYANAYYAEQAKKEKADADAIARGTLKILPDGTRIEKFSGLKRL
jgi:hypothetical protein